jgi:tRNA nucleotidyltransferase (CCA-adding enzyme)
LESTIKEVCADVLKRITPSRGERKRILELADKLVNKVIAAAKEAGIDAKVRVEGSVAKDTWLSDEPEIDIFMRVPITLPRESFGTTCLEIAREATEGFKQIERFAEHPYLESIVDEVRVNVVPCYQVKRYGWISATDRTPFHTDYVKPLLDETMRGEVRLLKKFMKGIGVYGAEIKIGGFSGYLCELLTLNYGSFIEVLKAVADWKEKIIIDYEEYYKGREKEAGRIFEGSVILVDPVDKGRNVAAAVRKKRLDELVVASRAFLQSPSLKFFYPKDVKILNASDLINAMKTRGSTIVFVKFGKVKAVSDILWGQLYKSQRSLRKMLQQHDFNVARDVAWSDEENLDLLVFEVEQRFLPLMKKHLGPPIRKRAECKRFLQKHVGASRTISGPYVEAGRWVVEIKRKYTDAVKLVTEKLRDGGRRVGVASLISQAIPGSLEVLVNEEVMRLYSSNPEFAKFLTEYLEGKPRWLVQT